MLALLESPLFLKAVGLLAVVLIVLGLKHGYDERRRDEGRDEMRPQIAKLTSERDAAIADANGLRAAVTDANSKLADFGKRAKDAQALAALAIAGEQAKTSAWQGEATKLMAILARPKATDGGVCARTDDLLRDLIAGSVQ